MQQSNEDVQTGTQWQLLVDANPHCGKKKHALLVGKRRTRTHLHLEFLTEGTLENWIIGLPVDKSKHLENLYEPHWMEASNPNGVIRIIIPMEEV